HFATGGTLFFFYPPHYPGFFRSSPGMWGSREKRGTKSSAGAGMTRPLVLPAYWGGWGCCIYRHARSCCLAGPSRMLEAIVYIIFCVLTGLCGIDRRIGFFGTFLLALVTTPFVVLPVLLLTGPSRRAEWQRRN